MHKCGRFQKHTAKRVNGSFTSSKTQESEISVLLQIEVNKLN